MENMFKEFVASKRETEVCEPYVIIINLNITQKLYEYVKCLENIKLNEDGQQHKYCGELKKNINNFLFFWNHVIEETIKEADLLQHTADKEKLITLVTNTIAAQEKMHEAFREAFLPAKSDEERNTLAKIEALYENRKQDLNLMLENVMAIDTPEKFKSFIDFHLDLAVRIQNEIFTLTHTNIAWYLLKNSNKIKISLEQILLRMRNNLNELNQHYEQGSEKLLGKLYEANKQRIMATRLDNHRSSEVAEANILISKIIDAIEKREPARALLHLREEVSYWEKRLEDFYAIDKNIKKLRTELETVTKYLKDYEATTCKDLVDQPEFRKYNAVLLLVTTFYRKFKDEIGKALKVQKLCDHLKAVELPGPRKTCWDNMGLNYKMQIHRIEEFLLAAARALVTFFAVRGQNRVLFRDQAGPYSIDTYGHKVYHLDRGTESYHVTCDGAYVQYPSTDKYYYDERGRYVINENGEKLYQIAPCTSLYKLNNQDLLEKVTKDCGHSEMANPDCKMNATAPSKIEIFPFVDPVDIKGKLTPEVAKYLWDSLGSVLPDALHDVAVKQPKNPIYELANRLLYHKYRSGLDLAKKKAEAEKIRSDILKKRHESAVAASLAWKAKQVKKRKPEESDDAEMRVAIAAHLEQLKLAQQIDNEG